MRASHFSAFALGISLLASVQVIAEPVCIEVITCACNDETGECQEFPTPCSVPAGWTITGYSQCPVSESVAEGVYCLDVLTYARNPDTGECVEFPSSCIPEGWERCAGGA